MYCQSVMQDENYSDDLVIIEKDDELTVNSKKIQEEKKQYLEESKSQEIND